MTQFRRQALITLLKILDISIMISAFLLAATVVYLQTNTITFQEFLHMRFKIENYLLFSGFILLWYLIFSGFGLYRSKRLSPIKSEINDLLKASTLGRLLLYLAARFFDRVIITPLFIAVFWTATSTATVVSCVLIRKVSKLVRLHGHNLRFMLIVGSNERARKFARKIESRPELGYRFLGFVDEQWKGNGDLKNTAGNWFQILRISMPLSEITSSSPCR
jgi:FlaA1/EpsC-like NDP-sugar epimerase